MSLANPTTSNTNPSPPTPTKSAPKKPANQEKFSNPSSSKKTKIALDDLHEAAESIQQSNKAAKEKVAKLAEEVLNPKAKTTDSKLDPDKIGFIERFLHDKNPWRIFFSLGNEIAESFKDLAEHLLPKPLAMLFYGTSWSASLISTANRIYANGSQAKDGEQIKAGSKMLLHDGISTIGGTTAWAKLINKLQTILYNPIPLPKALKHFIKSIITLLSCKVVIEKLDPHALTFSKWVTGCSDDRYKQINEALESKNEQVKKAASPQAPSREVVDKNLGIAA